MFIRPRDLSGVSRLRVGDRKCTTTKCNSRDLRGGLSSSYQRRRLQVASYARNTSMRPIVTGAAWCVCLCVSVKKDERIEVLPLLSDRPAVTFATLKWAAANFIAL